MINTKIARRYTTSLYEIARETNKLDRIKKDFEDIQHTIENSQDLKLFLKSPIIKTDKKRAALTALFKDKLDNLSMMFIDILCKKNRENYLYDISIDFQNLLNEKRGILVAEIRTAIELTTDEKKKISDKLKVYTGKEIQPSFVIDKNVKGGFVARVKDIIIDASISRQLELLKEQFLKGSFRNN